KMLFHRYKFTKDAALREVISMFLKCRFWEYDMSIPIPVSPARMEERGYNQTSMVLEAAKVSYRDIRATDKAGRQSELGKPPSSVASISSSFKDDEVPTMLGGVRVLVVDVFYTSRIPVYLALEIIYTSYSACVVVLMYSKACILSYIYGWKSIALM